ncbi:3-deoxy-D-manno-octulosonic acid transferase [Hyphomicrobium methylovorum]|uniref:glycosyltransferase N-terminal domain-containing protein n=1 Tax=Hyphomicrobium methylovorum TaxID=84 RepID=UPI0015E69831|nr:glycosyltransferase N-terminal domain-containing protein [Hyphomicrobium methylovorum]MBA2126858.1 3-deoxy-D-manno-octulosonic acid transferase [Hyphomicrobium methylovorum]
MADTKKTLLRFGGRTVARYIRHVGRTSTSVYEPSDLLDRLAGVHPCIVACWHGQFMMVSELRPENVRVAAMVARHGDAELVSETMRSMDVELIRGAGAGHRKRDRGGAAALRASVGTLRDGASLVMTADVPPGPARVAGAGIIAIARISGRPIVPVAVASKHFASLDTWSRLTFALPYSKLAFVGGNPIFVPKDADADVLESKRLELETVLNAVTVRAYELAGGDINRATPLDVLAAANPPEPGLALKVYRAGTSLFRPAVPAFLNMRGRQGKENIHRRGERLGFAGRPRPPGQIVWVHAASVGEANAVLPMIDRILAAADDVHVLLTTGTTTSAEVAARRLPERAFHQYVPLDVPSYIERFLDHWRPSISIFTESDIWPNLVLKTAAHKIPLVLVNARMSPRSISRWRRFAKFGRPLFSRFSAVLTQNAQITRAIKRLGAPNVITAGNLKIDAPPPPVDADALATLQSAIRTRPVFLAASTHPGEDTVIAAAHALMRRDVQGLLTIIVPRHPDRGSALASSLGALGLKTELRSRASAPSADTEIYIADTIGELGTFYKIAPIALIGGSLVEHGGQNPIEAVRMGAAILSGPFTHNFRDAYAALYAEGGAAEVRSSDDIAKQVTRLYADHAAAEKMRAGADRALQSLGGALDKTLGAILPLLERQRR